MLGSHCTDFISCYVSCRAMCSTLRVETEFSYDLLSTAGWSLQTAEISLCGGKCQVVLILKSVLLLICELFLFILICGTVDHIICDDTASHNLFAAVSR